MILTSYEIQLFQSGSWRINTVFDDAELALFEARRMFDSGLYASIRVVREEFDDRSGGVTTRTVFKDAKTDKHNTKRVTSDASLSSSTLLGGAAALLRRFSRKLRRLYS